MFNETRGQTTIDYSVGVGVFLLSVIFVLFFIQPLLTPFTGGQADVMRSDRVADRLTSDMLLESDNPEAYVLDKRCTLYFFETEGTGSAATEPSDCRPLGPPGDINTAVGLESTKNINVTVENSYPSGGVVTMQNDDGDNVRLAIGEEPPTQGDVTVSQRHVYLDDEEYRVYVRIWGQSLGNN
jgi:hypothetical protein